ncbi:MAG: hypothetical protein C0599_15515 [Salinivirgaceae bacterium]|nr:MAG: hypothetical protein C0599_15515 [Salinivirgaceae bacterium]
MLEHQKNIILALRSEQSLITKEVIKSIKWLKENEICDLENWLKDFLPGIYEANLKYLFKDIPT